MSSCLLLCNPPVNRVCVGKAATLTVAELEITAPFVPGIVQVEVVDVGYPVFDTERTGRDELAGIAW